MCRSRMKARKFRGFGHFEVAVLVAHELVYLIDRRDGLGNLRNSEIARVTKTSESTRRFVGKLLSNEKLTPKSDGIPRDGNAVSICAANVPSSRMTRIYLFKNADTGSPNFVF